MTSEAGGEEKVAEYDRTHGTTTDADEQKPSGLSESGNKPPPQPVSFRVTTSK